MKEILCRTSEKPEDDELFRTLESKENGFFKSTHKWCNKCYEVYKEQCNTINTTLYELENKTNKDIDLKKIDLLSLYKRVDFYINNFLDTKEQFDIENKRKKENKKKSNENDLENIKKLTKSIFNCISSRIYHQTNCIIDESKENKYNFKHINLDFEHIFFIIQLIVEFIILYSIYNTNTKIPIKLKNKEENLQNIINLFEKYCQTYKIKDILKIREYEINSISYLFDKEKSKVMVNKESDYIKNSLELLNKEQLKYKSDINNVDNLTTFFKNINFISSKSEKTIKECSNKIPLKNIPFELKSDINTKINKIENIIDIFIKENSSKKYTINVKSHPKSR